MSAATIKQHQKRTEERKKQDRPSTFLGCVCSNPDCNLIWLVCEMPQPMSRMVALAAKHVYCPNCKSEGPALAWPAQVRTLLINDL